MINCPICNRPTWRFKSLAQRKCWRCYVRSRQNLPKRHDEPLYSVWCTMKTRCCNANCKSYPWYGAKGATVCAGWLNNYPAFRQWGLANGYRRGLTLERRNTSQPYCPSNCRWATRAEQSRHRVNTTPIHIVRQVKRLLRRRVRQFEICHAFKLSKWIVSKIARGRAWRGV